MLNFHSIRFRLAAWYFLSLAVVLALVVVGSLYALHASIYVSMDEALSIRLIGMKEILAKLDKTSVAESIKELEHTYPWRDAQRRQIFDDQNRLVYQSGSMAHDLEGLRGPFASSDTMKFMTIYTRAYPIRLASQRVKVNGATMTIEIAMSMPTQIALLHAYDHYLLLGVPPLLLVATLGGFLISRKALAPVDRIIEDARSITVGNLSQRLAVPLGKDELQRLSETLNQMLDRIEASVANIRQFTADASHELRAPMTLIHTAADFSLQRERSYEKMHQAMQQIFRESKHTVRLVDDLLLLARADSKLDAFEPFRVDLKELFSEVCQQGRTLAVSKGIEMDIAITPDPVEVKGDDASLERLFLILIDNAVKYTSPRGAIWMELRTEAGQAVFKIKDTGIGIAAADLPHIYNRFWRADKVRSRAMHGVGLGLSIAHTIVERHGGAISAQSELGKGSIFEVCLPLASPPHDLSAANKDNWNSPEAVNQ